MGLYNNCWALIMLKLLAITYLAALSTQAFSAEPKSVLRRLHHEYTKVEPSQILTLRTLVIGSSKEAVAISIVVGTRSGCTGEFSGLGAINGERIVVRPYKPLRQEENCKVSIDVNPTGDTVTVSESGCFALHGAGCGFEGALSAI